MRPNCTSIYKSNNNSCLKSTSSCFNPTPLRLIDNSKNFVCLFSPLNLYGFDKYKNLYNQIITKDKTAINSYKKSVSDSFQFIPSKSDIKIILREETDDEKNNNELLGNKRKRTIDNKNSENDSNKSTKLGNDNENKKKGMGRKYFKCYYWGK